MTTRRSFLSRGALAVAALPTLHDLPTPRARVPASSIPRGAVSDWHTHWVGPRALRLLSESGIAAPQGSIWSDVNERLAHLNQVGVRTQLVSWVGASQDAVLPADQARPIWRAHNDDVAELVRAHPGRFLGLATLPTADIPAAAAELDRAHRELGLIGATLPLDAFIHLESARTLAPIFEVAQRHRSLIYIHRGRAAPTIPHETPEVGATNAYFGLPASDEANAAVESVPGDYPVARTNLITSAHLATGAITLALTDFLDPYPNVTVQMTMNGGSIAHLIEAVEQRTSRAGEPDPTPRLRRLYYDTGSTGRGPRGIALAAKVIGADRILFGSDYGPWPSVEPFIQGVAGAGLTQEEQDLIYVENARAILRAQGNA